MPELLEVKDVHIRFRSKGSVRAWLERDRNPYIKAVCGVSLTIRPGETFALVGESGAGKTTLARSIIGLVTPCQGQYSIPGPGNLRQVG